MGSYHPTPVHYKLSFKAQVEGNCFASFGTPSFAPRYEKDFWPLVDVSLGSSNQLLYSKSIKAGTRVFYENIVQVLWSKPIDRFVDHHF